MRRTIPPIFLALAAMLVLPAMALGATANVTGTLTGSTLSLSTSATPSFSANLDLGDSTPTYTVPLTIQDTRGTGAGWNATITSTQFTTGGATPSLLATNASTITGVTNVCAGGTCTLPTNAITYPVAVPAAPTAPTAVKFFNAAANTGLGKFTNTPTIGVFVPQSSTAGTYTSTLTISIVSGP
ncbi:MAG: WxL domain-containing protein [Proteobacteria bacterium]|nr:WxL domain-containing protein [Pseudomonadota bacterium]